MVGELETRLLFVIAWRRMATRRLAHKSTRWRDRSTSERNTQTKVHEGTACLPIRMELRVWER